MELCGGKRKVGVIAWWERKVSGIVWWEEKGR